MIRLVMVEVNPKIGADGNDGIKVISVRHFNDNNLWYAEGLAESTVKTEPGSVFCNLYHCADPESPSSELIKAVRPIGGNDA